MKILFQVVVTLLGLAFAGCAHTPPKGSPERKAILRGTHEAFAKQFPDLKSVVFVVPYLKVHNGWAWIQINPQSADGSQQYESLSGLLQEKAKKWTLREWMPAEEGTNYEKYFKNLKSKYPKTPTDIFPR